MLEGHWAEGEKHLIDNVNYSDNPLLNYLAAARASQMQEQYHKRDEYLKKASSFGEDAEIAVAVSQASMQYDTGQVEQARATLTHLREISPEHPFPNQLLAKVYYKQEDWKQLSELIPELVNTTSGASLDKKYHQYMQRSVEGLFEITAGKQDLQALELIWEKLPEQVRQERYAVKAYANALGNAGGGDLAAPLLEEELVQSAHRELYACYGNIQHHKPEKALSKARVWEARDPNDSALLLCLARLENQCGNQEASANYYEKTIALVPDKHVYYEFAELLWAMGDKENAGRCNRQGLRYCVQGKARPFKRS
jgi:HemY protein